MATTATRSANTVYLSSSAAVSTIDAVTAKNVKLLGVVITTGASADSLTLMDVSTTSNKFKFYVAATATGSYPLTDMEALFPNGIRVALGQVDTVATLIIEETRS
jgi:hypothetical protein